MSLLSAQENERSTLPLWPRTESGRAMNRSRVFVVQQPVAHREGRVVPAFDFSAAAEFGRVEVLAPNGKHILTPDVFRDMLEEKLDSFDPVTDYILPTGDYTVLFFVGMLLGARFDHIRVLRWVSDVKKYQPLTLSLSTGDD